MSIYVTSINPNDGVGGGGCLCHPIKGQDTKGPFVVFPATETDSNVSPHAVLCAPCVKACSKKLRGEKLSAGEADEVATADDGPAL